MGGTLQKICKCWRDRTDPAAPQSDGKAPELSCHGAAHRFEQVAKLPIRRAGPKSRSPEVFLLHGAC
jgi:hypothetical protein